MPFFAVRGGRLTVDASIVVSADREQVACDVMTFVCDEMTRLLRQHYARELQDGDLVMSFHIDGTQVTAIERESVESARRLCKATAAKCNCVGYINPDCTSRVHVALRTETK